MRVIDEALRRFIATEMATLIGLIPVEAILSPTLAVIVIRRMVKKRNLSS